jgi:hypothetical protein
MYRRAHRIIVVTEAFRRKLVSRGVDDRKIRLVPNGANLRDFSPRGKDPELVDKLSLSGKFVIVYIGTHGMAHGLEFIVTNLVNLGEPNIIFIFIGSGSNKSAVVKLAEQLPPGAAVFLDPVPKDEVARYLSAADAALVPLRRLETFRSVIPSKIFEAAAMGKPILLGVDGQAREIIEAYHAGLYFEPENPVDFIEKTMLLARDSALCERLQRGCAKLAADYDRRALADTLLSCVRETVAGR